MSYLEKEIARLRQHRDELDEVVVDTSRDDGDRNIAIHASDKIAKKLLALGRLHANELTGETVTQAEIDEALGRVKPAEKQKRVQRKWTDAAIDKIVDQINDAFPAVKKYVDDLQEEVAGVVGAIGKRLKALEARPSMQYRGTFDGSEQYNPGDCVTDGGSVWYCQNLTRSRPGSSSDWKLCVKGTR